MEVSFVENELKKLRQKQRKLAFVLGELIYKLYKSQSIRFLYTSEGIEGEKEVKKMLRLLDHMNNRIKKFEEISSGKGEAD